MTSSLESILRHPDGIRQRRRIPYLVHDACERARKLVERGCSSREIVLRPSDDGGRAVWVKAYANDGDTPRRTQDETAGDLAGKDHTRLALDAALLVNALEGIAKVDDELGTSVGQNRLVVASNLVSVPLESPDAADDRREDR